LKNVPLYVVTGMVKPNELGGLFENWDSDKNGVIDILEVLLYTANCKI
jgi:hypothetical protein